MVKKSIFTKRIIIIIIKKEHLKGCKSKIQ